MKTFEPHQKISGTTGLVLNGDSSGSTGLRFEIESGEFGQVNSAVVVANSDAFSVEEFKDSPQVSGRLDSGNHVVFEIDPTNLTVTSIGAVIRINGGIRRLKMFPYAPPGHGPAVWLYTVLNLKLTSGELTTCNCTPEGEKYLRDTIQFEAGGRTWFLRDQLHDLEQEKAKELKNASDPIRSGQVWTEIRDGQDGDEIDEIASCIEQLLALALSRSIRFESRHRVDATASDGGFPKALRGWTAPMKLGSSRSIPDEKQGALRAYLEQTYPAFASNREWFQRTIELYTQGVLSSVIDVKLVFFSILLDRISTK